MSIVINYTYVLGRGVNQVYSETLCVTFGHDYEFRQINHFNHVLKSFNLQKTTALSCAKYFACGEVPPSCVFLRGEERRLGLGECLGYVFYMICMPDCISFCFSSGTLCLFKQLGRHAIRDEWQKYPICMTPDTFILHSCQFGEREEILYSNGLPIGVIWSNLLFQHVAAYH